MSSKPREIIHNKAKSRFEYTEQSLLCVLDYVLNGSTAIFTHTGVPPALGGRGIAADLVRYGLQTARANNWHVRADCSYVAAFIQKNSEFQDLLVKE